MLVGEFHFFFRDQHAAAFNASDFGFFQGDVESGYVCVFWRENAFHAGAGVGGAADDLVCAIFAFDGADLQFIRIGVFLGGFDIGDGEGCVFCACVNYFLDFEADRGQRFGDFIEGRIRI